MDNGDFFRFQDAKLKFNDRREDNLLIKVKDKGRMNSKEKYEGRQYSFLVQIGGRRRMRYMIILLNIIIFQDYIIEAMKFHLLKELIYGRKIYFQLKLMKLISTEQMYGMK